MSLAFEKKEGSLYSSEQFTSTKGINKQVGAKAGIMVSKRVRIRSQFRHSRRQRPEARVQKYAGETRAGIRKGCSMLVYGGL